MLTSEQKKWLAHLRDDDEIIIKPYDHTAPQKFKQVKKRLQSTLGEKTCIVHRGATSLGISGQDEIDVYIPVSPDSFNSLLKPLQKLFGKPKSLYVLERARFVTSVDGKHIDVFLINKEREGWKNGIRFETYLKKHPKALEKYQKLKEKGNGLSTREYYKRKINFINDILAKTESLS